MNKTLGTLAIQHLQRQRTPQAILKSWKSTSQRVLNQDSTMKVVLTQPGREVSEVVDRDMLILVEKGARRGMVGPPPHLPTTTHRLPIPVVKVASCGRMATYRSSPVAASAALPASPWLRTPRLRPAGLRSARTQAFCLNEMRASVT